MAKHTIKIQVPSDLASFVEDSRESITDFANDFLPLESTLYVLADARTNAIYCECHVLGSKLVELGTIDVPLDPDDQAEYRANRDIVEDHIAFEKMQDDAKKLRSFSNLVTEFDPEAELSSKLKVIGGQHRYQAIKIALSSAVDEYHGVKVYFGLNTEQRLDVQLISNTNIAVSPDLLDRMYETVSGPELRNWCQQVGLLPKKADFSDKRGKGRPITVRAARTFVMNYFSGTDVDSKEFDKTKTTPRLAKTGGFDPDWAALRAAKPGMWSDKDLCAAGKEFAKLIEAQRKHFADLSGSDFAEKASNYAVLSAWAFTAGILAKNKTRNKRHFQLSETKNKDPLNAAMLAKGRHKTDPENYRGLGYRTDAKERGRFVELFFAQSEKGLGITKTLIDVAIKKYHAKQAILDALEAEAKL